MKPQGLQQFLEVPLADPSQSRRAKMLNILLLGLTGLTILIIIVNAIGFTGGSFSAAEARLTNIVTLFFLISSFIIYWTNKNASSQLAAILFLGIVTTGLMFGDSPYETVWGRNMIALIIPILMASLILDPRASFVMAGIIGIASIGLASANDHPSNIVGLVLYIAIALISWLTTRSLEQAITDLKKVNLELDQRVEKRTTELKVANLQLKQEVSVRLQTEQALEAERGLLAKRVKQRTAELQSANEQLQEMLTIKDEFLAKMSHELRTPLSAILMITEIMQMEVTGNLNHRQQKHLATINESGQHLLKLINDVLDVAKIQAGQLEIAYEEVDVSQLCQSTFKLIKPLAEDKQIELILAVKPSVQMLKTNEKRLKQILINLLTNGIKFTHAAGKVGLTVEEEPEYISFNVWDTGIGMDPNEVNTLFEPFVQLDNSTTRQHEGSGLGLTLVKQFTNMLNGHLYIDTEIGHGSQFNVMLPKQPDLAQVNSET